YTTLFGSDCESRQGSEVTEVQGPSAESLQAVQPSAGVHAEVRHVSVVLQEARARRRCHGRDEELLVETPKTPRPDSQARLRTHGLCWKVGNWELVVGSWRERTQMTDPISDMLTRLRNAVSAKHARVD